MRAEIKKLENDKAILEVRREAGCSGCAGGCGSCSSGAGNTIIIKAGNSIGAEVGDIVEVESKGGLLLGYAALIFLLPLTSGFLGYFITHALSGSTALSYGISGALFVLSVAVLFPLVNKAASRTENYIITGFIKRAGG
ncbi:MAG: SoxR reducing system RseC family protein [Eubacteriales bacterium]